MIGALVLAATVLAATPNVVDETDSLNATQRAELSVAADDFVQVVLVDEGSLRKLHERASQLVERYPGRTLVVFDTRLDVGLIEPLLTGPNPHADARLTIERLALADRSSTRQARLLRAVRFACPLGAARPDEAAARPGVLSRIGFGFGFGGGVYVLVALGLIIIRISGLASHLPRRPWDDD